MAQSGDRLDLAHESVGSERRRQIGVQHLERHRARGRRVAAVSGGAALHALGSCKRNHRGGAGAAAWRCTRLGARGSDDRGRLGAWRRASAEPRARRSERCAQSESASPPEQACLAPNAAASRFPVEIRLPATPSSSSLVPRPRPSIFVLVVPCRARARSCSRIFVDRRGAIDDRRNRARAGERARATRDEDEDEERGGDGANREALWRKSSVSAPRGFGAFGARAPRR